MIRKLVLAASAVALVGGSLAMAAGSASAGAPPISAGAGSSLHCTNVATSVKVNPPLKDDWMKSEHSGDSNSDVKNIPNTPFAPPPPEHVSAKGASSTCGSSIAKSGSTTSHISKIKLTMVDQAPTTTDGSCINLVNNTVGGDSDATYKVVITYTAASGNTKINATTINNAKIGTTDAALFTVFGGTVSGSFAGSTNLEVDANVDGPTIALFGSVAAREVASSSHPAAYNACEPGVKIKGSPSVPSKPHSAAPVKPKGVKKIGIDTASTEVNGTR